MIGVVGVEQPVLRRQADVDVLAGDLDARALLRFGVKVPMAQAKGAYRMTVQFEVVAHRLKAEYEDRTGRGIYDWEAETGW